MFTKKTVRDVEVRGKRVLLRADYNVPLDNGKITDDYRIKQSLPTLKYLLGQGAAVIICSHLGRPNGKVSPNESLRLVATRLSELLGQDVQFVGDCVGPEAEEAARQLEPGRVLLLENLRFHPEEEANDSAFAKQLAGLADVFVQDGFAVVHRAHASTETITRYLPGVAGLLLEREVDVITSAMQHPQRPLVAVVGGAKISDKIDVLERFVNIADMVLVGGAMANTFLAAQGVDVADSLVEPDEFALAEKIVAQARVKRERQGAALYLPFDGVVAHAVDASLPTRIVDWSSHLVASIEEYPKKPPVIQDTIHIHEKLLDIGPLTATFYAGAVQLAGTVIWNGAMGVTETPSVYGGIGPYAHGTETVMQAILGTLGHRPFSLAGGGDTVGYIEQRGLVEKFDHVSTGGGASLELMAGKTLPGVAALEDK